MTLTAHDASGLLVRDDTQIHAVSRDALGVSWEELPTNYQGFLLGVVKGMGAGSIGVTLALLIMLLIPFRRGDAWVRWAVPAVGVAFTSLTAYAAFTIAMSTPASTPWRQTRSDGPVPRGRAHLLLAVSITSRVRWSPV